MLHSTFLIGFIESMADFGNPLVLVGSHGVLSTEIFFAVVGAQHNPARAAVLALVLLCFTLTAFFLQCAWLKGRSHTTVTGKGDRGRQILPDPRLSGVVHAMVPPGWSSLSPSTAQSCSAASCAPGASTTR